MTDYTMFYKSELPVSEQWPAAATWDVFISAYNSSERVNIVYERVAAKEKHWLILPDYGYDRKDWPSDAAYSLTANREGEFVRQYLGECGAALAGKSICIDITGFIKPYMMFLLYMLVEQGVRRIDVIYSEPSYYAKKEETKFSDEMVVEVRQVDGFEGCHIPDTSNDILIIGSGYDHELIAQAAENKDNARKIQLFGLPSLRAHMYQENVLRAHRASEAVGGGAGDHPDNYFAPANDPFVTATVLSEIVQVENLKKPITNLYLCPVATKPQSLGFTIFYLTECRKKAVSMIYPFCRSHSQETSKGISRIWKYTVELPPSP